MAFDREKTLQAAQKYIDKRKYDRAILEYQKVVQHEPNDARTLLRIGDLQARLGTYPEAIGTYDRVALYYAGRGFSLKAIAVLKQISELIERHAPQLADQYSHIAPKLAQIYAEMGLTNDALATYDAIARRLQERGRDRDAVEIIRRMVALDRSNPLPYLRLAEALCRVTRVDEAMEHFWSAAQLLMQQGRSEDATKVLERILHFRQDARVARVAAQLYLSKGTRDAGLSALSRLQLCFDADPRDLDTLTLLAKAFDIIGQPAKGIEVYKEMVRIATETGQQELRARFLQHLVDVAPHDEQVRALGVARRPTSAPPRSSIPAESIGEDDIEFIESVAPPPKASPRRQEQPTARNDARNDRARSNTAPLPSEGSAAERRATLLRDAPASEFLRKALLDAESFRGLKLYSKASAALRHALTVAPQSIELRAALQQILLEMGDRSGAVEQMLAIAQIYLDRGSLSAAEAELYKVLEIEPDLPAALLLLRRVEALAPAGRRSTGRSGAAPPGPDPPRDDAAPSQTEHEAFELRARVAPQQAGRPAAPGGIRPPVATPENNPLPAYELDDDDLVLETSEVVVSDPTPGGTPAGRPVAPAGGKPGAGSAPRAAPAPSATEEPLPQFALESAYPRASAAAVPAPIPAAAAAPAIIQPAAPAAAAQRSSPAQAAQPVLRPAAAPARDVVPNASAGPAPATPSREPPRPGKAKDKSVAPAEPAAALRGKERAPGISPQPPPVMQQPALSPKPPAVGVQPVAASPKPPPVSAAPESARPAVSLAPASERDTPSQKQRESIRAALDEAEFFSSRGLYQDALMVLRDRLDHHPGTPDLIEAIARLEPKISTESGTRDVAQLSGRDPSADDELIEVTRPSPMRASAAANDPSDAGGKELRVQFSADGTLQAGPIIDADADADLVKSLEQPRQTQVDVDEVFAKFKQGVKAQVSDSDSATHYDLGVAYKEMGLLVDAAREFEIAARDPKRECNSLAMMGMIYRERNELDKAAEAYVRGLNASQKTVSQEVSLYYDLGLIYEMKGDADEAIYYFQRITRRDPTYRDVAQRLKVLLPRSRRFSQPARAINDDQEFERSFDDLYKPK